MADVTVNHQYRTCFEYHIIYNNSLLLNAEQYFQHND